MIRPEYKDLIEKEGNLKEFVYKGFNCKIVRVMPETSGHLCGYIEIPIFHELHKMDYDAIEEKYDYEIPAHGGLTFSDSFKENDHWIGFDCAHSGDLSPCFYEGFDYGYDERSIYMDMKKVEQCIKEIIDFIEEEQNK